MSHHSLTNCKIRTLAAETRDDVGQTNELKTPTTRKPLFIQRLFWLWSFLALPGLFNRLLLCRGSEGSVVDRKYHYKFGQTSFDVASRNYKQSISSTRKSILQKKEFIIIPASNLSIQTKTIRWKSISIHRNVRSILKMLSITGWSYSQSLKLNKSSITETLKGNFNNWGTKIVLPISLFLLVASNVYAAPPNYTVVGVDKFNGADGAGNSISQNATALGGSFNAIIRNGSTNDFTFDCGSMTTNSEDQPKGAIIFRYTSASSFYAVTYHRDLFGTGNYMVRLKLNTLNSPISSTGDLGSYTIPGGGGVTSLKVTAVGSSIKIWINGTLRINVTNSAHPSGSYGFGVGPRLSDDSVIWNNVVWSAAASGPSESIQNFGTGTTGFGGVNVTSTTYLPNPTPAGTTFVRSSNGTGGGLQLQNSSALGTTGSILRATASTNGSVVKVTPILENNTGKVAYARFKAMFGNSTGGNTATSGIWQMFLGNGAMYSDANGFTSNQVNVGLQFTYGASGAITMNYRNNGAWSTTSLTSNPLYQSVYYDFEIFSNNKSSGTENYTYNGVSSTVAVGKFDLYVNGRIIGNELNDGELASNTDIRSITFTGISSASNVANIFLDDVALHNTIPATTTRLTNPAAFDLSSANYSFTTWANTSTVGTTPSNMKFHWSEVNSQNPTLVQSVATQDYVWGYNYSMADSRIIGLGASGIEFRQANTGHSSTSSGNLGEAVVSVNASNRQDVQVSWVAALNTNATVDHKLRAQYRIGNTGAYTDLPGTAANIEFNSTGATVGTPVSYGPITLPAACNNQSEVQIRWVYYWGGSGTGAGDGIRLDEISISSVCFAPVATAGSALTAICQGGTSAALGGSVASPATGGTWSTTAGGTFSPNATTLNATWTPPAAYSGTATLTLTTSGGSCGTATSSKTIVVTPTNTAGTASSTPTLCINTALTNITRTTTGATGISNSGVAGANGLPAGVSAAWASNTITISGTPTASGTFNYSIPLTGGCGAVNATGTITVTPAKTPGTASSNPTLCINTALTNITRTTTGATGISNSGVAGANGLPAGVSAAWASNTITISGTPTASGTFNYSIPLTGGCGAVNATGTITVTPANTPGTASSTPTLCINTALTAITRTTTGATGIGAATGLPAGVTAAWAANVLTISGTPTASGTFNYSIPLTGGCGAVNATGTITVTPANTAGTASSNPTLCINTALTNITRTTTGATGIGAATGLPAGVTAAWAANVLTISGTPTASGTFNYSIPLTGGCGSVNATGTITVTPANTAGAASSMPTLCANTPLTAITHATTGATGIGAATGLPAGVTAAWAANVLSISGTPTAAGTFGYTIPLTGGCGSVSATGTITVNPPIPAQPAAITGTATQCPALTSQTYSIAAVTNATSYNWTVPTGWTITAGSGTNGITVTTGSAGQNGNISVTAQNSCGTSTAQTLAVTVSNAAPVQPGTISGLAVECPALTGQIYSIAAVTNATTYNWTVPSGWSITAGAGTASITVTTGSAGQNGNISVTAQNSCGTSTARTLAVTVSNVAPVPPGSISGTAVKCPGLTGQIYSIGAVTNATSYNWTVPTGWTITAGSGTNGITVTTGSAGQNGNISVTAQNSCGTSTAQTLAVTVSPATPATPGAISGTAVKCPALTGQIYSIAAVTNATTYNWTVPSGWTITAGAGTTSITVTTGNAGQNGNISVTAQNSCGTSAARTLAVTVSPATPAQPAAITGTAVKCPGLTGQVYSIGAVSNATSYNWSVPTGWSITANTGTSITVSTGTAGQNGNISVTAQNSCGTSTARTLAVTVSNAAPVQPGSISGLAVKCPGLTGQVYSIAAVTNATTYNWTVPTGWTITAGAGTVSITVTTGSAGQNGNISVTAQNSCGTSTAQTLAVTVSPATPLQPSLISGTATQCPALTAQTYSIPSVTNATTYNWTVPTGWNITAGAGTTSITVTTGTTGQNGNISVTAQNSCGTSTARTLAVTVSNAAPVQPGSISGLAVKCPGLTGQVYSIAAVTNATTYNWTVPTGWTITAGAGTVSITVTTGSAGQNGNISVTAQNSCGTSTAQTLAVTVSPAIPAAPAAAAGSNVACTSISANWAASANATVYFLDVSTVNNFATFVTGFNNLNVGNVTTYSVTGLLANTTYYYRVRANNSCGTSGNSSMITYATSPLPAQPSTITGTLNPEIGLTQAYSVTNVAGVTYAWSFTGPNGWSVTSGQGSNAIVANVGTANTTITVVPSNTCGNGTSRTIATTIPQYRARFISANYGASPWCQGESRSISVVVKNTGVASWTNASPDVKIGAKWNTNGANWTDYLYRVDAGGLAPGAQQTYTFAAMQASNATVGGNPPTYTTGLNAGNNNITFDIAKEGDCWFGSNGGTCGPGNSVLTSSTIVISPAAPATPGAITGAATKCPALTGQTYSIAAVANATSYNWTVPAGWSITANTGTSITVTTGTTGQNGNISVTAQNSCGTSTARTLAVTVSNAAPAVPTAAAGTNAACTTISANWAASTNATAYFLDVSTVNTFASFVTGYNNLNVGNVITRSVTGLTAGVTYYYRVRANNSCGTSASSATITYSTSPATPAQPGTITGTTNLCAAVTGQIYSISAVANATTYNWTVPTGWTITAGAGTTSITVTTGAGGQNGNIGVRAQNSCGTSSERTLGVTVTPNPTVNVGGGLAAICAGGNSAALGGSVTSPATGGTWTSSAGGTFNPNATTLNATWTAPAAFSGTSTLTLTSSGGICGTATGSKSITVNPLPANAGAITGTATVCQGQSGVVFSVPAITNANTYSWSYSGTGFTASGSTASIFGSFSATATSGNLTVRGVNACGNGVVSATYAITVNNVPSAAGAITGSPSLCQGQNGVAYSVAPIAGATSYLWSYTGTGFTASGSTASITANFSASATAGVLTVRGVNSCGNGIASANYNISVAQLPGTPGTILGPSTVCKGQAGFTFTIPAIANATSYNWVYTGTGITFSGNTATVTATISNTATSGVIRVRGVSACLNGPFSADFTVTVNNAPTVSITSNYCGNPGFVILTASPGFSNYLWNTGATTSFINADIAGQYTVTAANATGCLATASVGVATELVTNGSFSAGNTGFTTNYTYVADIGGIQSEMYPEGTYAVVPNSNTVHNYFYGTGHTPAGGPYMVVNGSPAVDQTIWSQNNITVQPNTTYYFSAWGMSVVNGNNGVLRFSINGNQIGTIAFLPNGYTSTAGPFNWVRFYGSWNSGFATEADLSIINLNTILGGNDFGLDDISFGTLSPVALSVTPSTIIGTTVCQGNELVLNANAVGGASPFTYQWTGPNGFTSTVMNPTVTASAAAVNAGTYTLTVTDGFGCTATSNVVVTISALPLDRLISASASTVCVNASSNIEVPFSQTGVSYQLRNDADDSPVGDPIAGTGGTIIFPINNLIATTTYNVLATGALTQCSAEMSNTVTVTVATTPVLSITNQAICSGTVDLTAAGVTAGSTGSGTLSYWTNAAATTSLATPTSVATSGVYYIRSIVGSCVDIEPVTVSISTTPITGFTYPGTPYCSTELDPTATMNANAVAGVFTSLTAGLVFSNTSTGTIDLSASTPGTYTVRNTVSPTGGCPSVNSTSPVVITGAPLTGFSYDAGSDFCQIYSAQNPAPVFEPGAAAGTFASTFGLNFISTATGVVNLQTSTPGNYAIWNTRPAIGGCAAESDTVFIDINPYVFAGTVTTSVSDDIICLGDTIDLFSQTTAYNSVLLRERFNGTINNWAKVNASVGGTTANAAWTLRPNNYSYNSNSHRSNDNTQFYMSNSDAQAGTTTLTTLRSPEMSTVGYTNLSLDFFHYFDSGNNDTAQVQVSLNNTTWTTVATYTNDAGGRTSFANQVINLNAYIGQPIFYVRFRYSATDDRQWAIDNVSLTGNCNKYFYDWASAPAGFSSTSANPVNVTPPQNSFYVVDATNTFGCSNPSSPIPVTVNALPILTSSLTPPAVCGNEVFAYVPSVTPASALVSWTRPAATGITNAAITAAQSSNPSETLVNLTNADKNVIYNFTLDNNGCSQVVPVTVAVKPIPVIDLGTNLSVCNGSPAQLNTTITNGLTVDNYSWSPSTGLSSTTISDPTAIVTTASQNYTVTVQSTNGCSSTSAAISVTNTGFGGTAGLWLGTVNSNWDDCRNWADGRIPTNVTNVTVDGNALNDIQVTGSQQCNNLVFLSNNNTTRSITLLANSTLTASGNVAVAKSAGTGTITLTVMPNATLNCNDLSISGTASGASNAIVQKDMVNTAINVNGSLSIDPGAQLDLNDGNNGTSEGTLSVKGNFVNNGNAADFNVGNVEIIFNGNALQTITCPTNQDFGSVTLDNSSVAGVRLNNNIAVTRGMQFVNGLLDLNLNTLTLGSSTANAAISGSGNNSYILAWDGSDNGTVIQQVNNLGFSYVFPIGDLNDYTPISVNLSSATLSNATLTAKLYGTVHPNIIGSTNYLGRYWSIEPTGITDPLYSVQYNYAAVDIFGSEAFLFPAKYNSGGWQSCIESASNAMIGNGSVNAGTNTLTWTGITTFSEFTAIGNGTPLPIELLDFTAEPTSKVVNLKWITASETNNSHFTVERSSDGVVFKPVLQKPGAGNSNSVRSYSDVDTNPLEGVSYYRLKQTDFNGDFTYSEWVVVNFIGDEQISLETVFADRSTGNVFFRCNNPENQNISINIFDAAGKMIHSSSQFSSASNWSGSVNVGSLSKGSYIVRLSIAGQMLHGKFVY